MRIVILALLALIALGGTARANDWSACQDTGPLIRAAYCGRYSAAPITPSGGTDNRSPCSFWVAASGGSDTNAGTSAAPFATLAHTQTVMQGSTGSKKVGCLKAGSGGSYTLTASIALTSIDSGETWETDPASPIGSAVVNGNNAVTPFTISGASNITINGLHVTAGSPFNIGWPGGSSSRNANITIENNETDNNSGGSGGALQFCNICVGNTTNAVVANNYVHDSTGPGIAISAWGAGQTYDGALVENNVVLRACKTLSDCGALYINAFNNPVTATNPNGAGAAKFLNNFARDQGSASLTNDVVAMYLDDKASFVTVEGNILGPPCQGCLTTGNRNNSSGILLNDDTYVSGVTASETQGDVITGNIIDVGGGGANNPAALEAVVLLGGQGTRMTGNIVLYDFTGTYSDSASGVTGFAYYNASATSLSLKNNDYVNYAGGTAFSNGHNTADSAPQIPTTAQLACSGYLYTLSPGSIAFSAPVNFPQIAGGWGPPNFTVPTSSNHSCP